MRPARTPIGLQLTQASRVVSRAFDDALAAAGGSLPIWLVLLSLKTQNLASQRELAEAMGIREATLTHHLTAMESAGLVSRRRDAANRRVQVVELTAAGDQMFGQLVAVALSFDKRLRHGVSAAEVTALEDVLARLAANVGEPGSARPGAPPWTVLADSARG
jgi:MarR family transcriptional regulator, transcriptional regulator for hemolysin